MTAKGTDMYSTQPPTKVTTGKLQLQIKLLHMEVSADHCGSLDDQNAPSLVPPIQTEPAEICGIIPVWSGLFAGLGSLSQVLSANQLFSTSLTHLDLSGNLGSLVTEDATVLSPWVCHV